MKRASFHTLGCRLNQADSALLASDLSAAGYEIVPWGEEADVLVINSCAVTAVASQKSRQAVTSARKAHPNAYLVVCGCAATDSQLLSGKGALLADLLLPNPKPKSLAALLPENPRHEEHSAIAPIPPIPHCEGFTIPGVGLYPERTRANLKVQDGCSFRCTYCIVPSVRGPARSRDLDDIVREARALLEQGYRELVLTGVNVATYRQGDADLATVFERLLELPGDFRLRMGSVEPGPLLDRVIDIMAQDKRMCRFLHLPLQNGDAGILRRMARRYTLEEYARTVNYAAEKVSGICLGTDIMVGFPGEDDGAFKRCYDYLSGLPLSLMHVFCYSPRPGTPAATWPGRPQGDVAKERMDALLELAADKARAFAASQVGERVRVLLETGEPLVHGWSDNYLKVVLPAMSGLDQNTFHECRIAGVLPGTEREVAGEIIK
ncbi:MAG: MiaB/RimO family radical SAM methylthiotransferase [Lentisphaeria bacterium]|nr:MiaB/RimO family radical SAM methylthiotransferase [Lentisphaeria bacterium]